jgi:Zn-dependent protease
MAAAGPAANAILVLAMFATLKVGLAAGTFVAPSTGLAFDRLVEPAVEAGALHGLGRLLSVMLSLNLVLCLLNLMPFPPLDGASVVAGFVSPARRAIEWVRAQPMFGLLGLLLAWRLFSPVFGWFYVRLLHALYAGG